MEKENQVTKNVNVKLSESQMNELKSDATKQGLGLATFIRTLLIKYLNTKNNE